MPAVQYPFIDIAVHERVRDHFARGEAIVLFSVDLGDVLWANGAGASLFGKPVIYDLIEDGPNRNDVTFRQVEATGQQLTSAGTERRFLIRIPSGFQRVPVEATVERIHLTRDVDALLFAAPVSKTPLSAPAIAKAMLDGFDDPDTHMAVLGAAGEILSASAGFRSLDVTPATARTLVGMAANQPDHLVKRPIPTGRGYLPAAIGKVSDSPAMHLLFAVETILGTMGPATAFPEEDEQASDLAEPAAIDTISAAHTAERIETEAELPTVEHEMPEEQAAETDAALPDPAPANATAPTEADAEAPLAPVESVDETPGEATTENGPVEETAEPHLSEPAFAMLAEDTAPAEAAADEGENAEQPTASDLPAPDQPETEATGEDGIEHNRTREDWTDADQSQETAVSADTPLDAAHTEAPANILEVADPALPDDLSAGEPGIQPEIPLAQREEASIPGAADGFSFNPAGRPTRFVWKIDAEGHFSEVSPELAAAVGPHASFLPGTPFGDIARLLNLDPEGKIAELLSRRDTWSGKTIYWPIEGTAMMAPVDLAALPTYRRNREFDGFRGFGIVRLSDAIEDPEAIGLTLAPAAADTLLDNPASAPEMQVVADEAFAFTFETPATETVAEAPAPADEPSPLQPDAERGAEPAPVASAHSETDQAEAALPLADMPADTAAPDSPAEQASLDTVEDGQDQPATHREEPPVLRFTDSARREGEKVIRLEERRTRGRDGLTAGEQEAFREIARQLEPLVRREPESPANDTGALPGNDFPADLTGMTGSDLPPAETDAEETPAATGEGDAHRPAPPIGEPASSASESEQLEILASAIPPRTAMSGGLSGAVIDEIPVALLIHAGDRLIHANPEFLRLSGYAALADLEAVGGLDSLLHHKDLEDMPEQSGGLSLVRADDMLIPVTARLQSVRWEDTNALLLALIPSGVRPSAAIAEPPELTDEEEARLNTEVRNLKVEVEELRSILETATDGVVIIGPEGEIRSMNRSASALFDYDDGETRGKPFVMLFAHESHRAVADYLSGMTGHGVASVLNDGREVIGREASGGFIPLFMTIGKLSASNGFCAVIRDITQWKRSEEDLKSAKRAAETANAHKSDFLARVSHEIRTPLNAIIGFSDMMAIEHFGPIGHPRYVEYANDIARSGRLVLDIVNDLLDISKIEAGEMDLEFTAVGLNDAVSEAVSLVQPQAHNQRVIIRTAFSDAVPDVVADLRSIKQIVLNILANAIRFTQAGGQIVVSTSYETNGSVVLRIRDTGIGMTRAELEQAMKPFRQVTAGARKRGDGTGLGLPLTKAMVDANRAAFTIQSAPNEGTLVEITFPSPRVLAN